MNEYINILLVSFLDLAKLYNLTLKITLELHDKSATYPG